MSHLPSLWKSAALALMMTLVLAGIARAAGGPAINVELNTAKQTDDTCTLSFVFRNGLATPIEAMTLEVVLFDKDGLVDKFLRLKTGPLPTAKLRVKQFALKGRQCASLSRILINGVPDCSGGKLTPAQCLGALNPSSRAAIALIL
ncbi:MAG: hypothetical protein C0605_03335 [Hyphomicrobiales bacterium]|nr:MAG: hypothetical protein C0605_03335 [Hyphomicrobiales bacterium]